MNGTLYYLLEHFAFSIYKQVLDAKLVYLNCNQSWENKFSHTGPLFQSPDTLTQPWTIMRIFACPCPLTQPWTIMRIFACPCPLKHHG